MNWPLLCRLLGLLGMLVGGSMVFSLPWAFPACGQTETFEARGFQALVASIVCSLACGGVLYTIGRRERSSILRKEALAVVGLSWILAGILGSLPYLFSGTERSPGVPMTVADALFESVSGFTTTGASVLNQLEAPDPEAATAAPATEGLPADQPRKLIPRCVLFWRCFTHWLGGMGIIVLFVAILGQLGAGGKALMKREVPGPINESVRPRVRDTAVTMWSIYVALTVLLTIILYAEGMTFYDALCHTFGTLATGGFSTRNASLGYYGSPVIELTIVVFMVIAGTNFALYYIVLRSQHSGRQSPLRARLAPLTGDPEYRVYLGILLVSTLLLTASLYRNELYPDVLTCLRHGGFIAVSIMTTTGFGTEDFHEWTEFSKGLLLMLMFVGGCAGSTGGGVKVIRFILFQKVIRLEIEQAFRPNVIRPLRIFGRTLPGSMRHEVVVYFSLVLFIAVFSWVLLAAIEPDAAWDREGHSRAEKLLDSASAVASCLNNIGPGLGILGPHSNYSGFTSAGKLLLTLLMLLGRLELFAILALFVPSFWRTQ
ncbi:MAG: TrkH family potassium uptake protein [Planctomycetaceae bacterium]|nr:TrkH family potassium uptake protein [Planctomycetaceae bacterium]